MSAGSAFSAAQPFIVGIGMPIALALLSVILPVQFAQQSSLARIEQKFDDFKTDIGKSLDEIKSDLKSEKDRLDQNETDPNKVLANAIGVSQDEMNSSSLAFIKGKLVAFPKTDKAKGELIAAGFSAQSVAPTISGFVMGPTVVFKANPSFLDTPSKQ